MDYKCATCGEEFDEPKLLWEWIDGSKCYWHECPYCDSDHVIFQGKVDEDES